MDPPLACAMPQITPTRAQATIAKRSQSGERLQKASRHGFAEPAEAEQPGDRLQSDRGDGNGKRQ